MTDKLDDLLEELEKTLEEAKVLTTKERKRLKDKTFAFPKQEKMPLNDAEHVRAAMSRFSQVKGVTPEEKKTAYNKILRAAKKFGIDATGFKSKYGKTYS